jgi:phytoene dehydrogenase-like protein
LQITDPPDFSFPGAGGSEAIEERRALESARSSQFWSNPPQRTCYSETDTTITEETMDLERREFLKLALAGGGICSFDWDAYPQNPPSQKDGREFDAIIIGAGLGGLACGMAFARKGFRPLVLEQHDRPGGYATAFNRPGGYIFDVSLHSTTVGRRDSLYNLIPGFPEITEVEFVPHPYLYRAIFPDHDLRVPQRNIPEYVKLLSDKFPAEEEGIKGIIEDMQGLQQDIGRLSGSAGQPDLSRLPKDFPYLLKSQGKTWGQVVDARIKDPKLKAIISNNWGYYGLPPSRLSCFYYALPTIGYLSQGGFYPRGSSQRISNSLARYIDDHGGKVVLRSRVREIVVKDHTALGVRTTRGEEYTGRAVVSNANAYDTIRTMMSESDYLKEYLARMDRYSTSLSSFQVFLGLRQDLVRKLGISDSEIFYHTSYEPEAEYEAALKADVENSGWGLMLYDNLYADYSPKNKNTVNILTLQGYDHWKQFDADYQKGNKGAYRAEKERMARILMRQVEKAMLPGLTDAIEVMEIGTPLTNIRYTGNYRGAIYGWDQTVDNTGLARLPHRTPIRNLYLAGAWTSPGHGYGGVLYSGLECFAQIMRDWI